MPIAIAADGAKFLHALHVLSLVQDFIKDLMEASRYVLFLPKKLLEILHPFEIVNDDSAGITLNVRDEEDIVAPF